MTAAVRAPAPDPVHDEARLRDNPLVGIEGIRCYAGIPLISARGFALGSLCVIGTEARSFAEEEVDELRAMAREVVRRAGSRWTTDRRGERRRG